MTDTPVSYAGLAAAFAAFVGWGLLPIYWKALGVVPSLELLCHRIVWSLVFVALVLTLGRRWGEVRDQISERRTLLLLAASSTLIACNWFVYIWSVNNGHVVESSLGYYINPLVNVLLGWIFFQDKLRRPQWIAIGLALAGVLNEIIALGEFPWIALTLAFSFGFYGLVRKVTRMEAVSGLFVETLVLGLPAAAYLVHLHLAGTGALTRQGAQVDLLLVGAGAATSLPLIGFAFGARRLRLVTVGILQYIAPTSMFLLGVFAYGEPFSRADLATFVCIWLGVLLYTVESISYYRRIKRRTS